MLCLRPTRRSISFLACLLPLCGFALGCGGPGGYQYSGAVTFDGKPVPSGKILFLPDGSKGNSGAAGSADIKDGQYTTNATGSRGALGGPTIVRIDGLADGTPLFTKYEVAVDLPKSNGTKDFDVPASAAKPKSPSSGPKTAGPKTGGPGPKTGPKKTP